MNIDRYFICTGIGNLRLHSCLEKKKTVFVFVFISTPMKEQNEKRSIAKKLRNGLESLRDAKINKKLETLNPKPSFLSKNWGVLYINHIALAIDPLLAEYEDLQHLSEAEVAEAMGWYTQADLRNTCFDKL